jgi:hypothetical protein
MKMLPIGIQTFENLIQEGYVYVDKTNFVSEIACQGKYYFLSRPRRFGKSLFLSTLKAAFEGKRELFKGLYLYDNWDWDETNPVILISFGSGVMRSVQDLRIRFGSILEDLVQHHDLSPTKQDLRELFSQIIKLVYEKAGQKVVILVDEYDKPILDNIHKTDLAVEIREELKNYYSVIKDADPYVRLAFITGVSKFSKVSLFSGLNNLKDITIDERFSILCGYTQKELEEVFADRLSDVNMDEVKKWYNGYSWLGEKVYNPFDILLYLDSKQFLNYWFESATPTFLLKLLFAGKYMVPELNSLQVGETLLGSFDVDRIKVETLLFQTGYLTIHDLKIMGGMRRYTLGYPNQEVRQSLADYILGYFTDTTVEQQKNAFALYEALEANDLDRLRVIFHAFFASIPYDWYKEQQAAGYEAYYASIVYCYFAATGIDVRPEVHSNKGRLDLVVRFENRIYVIEFKVVEQCGEGKALEQIKSKGYLEQFAGQEVYLIGVDFSSEKRNIETFAWEKAG